MLTGTGEPCSRVIVDNNAFLSLALNVCDIQQQSAEKEDFMRVKVTCKAIYLKQCDILK